MIPMTEEQLKAVQKLLRKAREEKGVDRETLSDAFFRRIPASDFYLWDAGLKTMTQDEASKLACLLSYHLNPADFAKLGLAVVGLYIKRDRENKGLSIEDFAEKIGCDVELTRDVLDEHGYIVDIETAKKIYELLDWDTDELYEDKEKGLFPEPYDEFDALVTIKNGVNTMFGRIPDDGIVAVKYDAVFQSGNMLVVRADGEDILDEPDLFTIAYIVDVEEEDMTVYCCNFSDGKEYELDYNRDCIGELVGLCRNEDINFMYKNGRRS